MYFQKVLDNNILLTGNRQTNLVHYFITMFCQIPVFCIENITLFQQNKTT
jgi:hypothetical protein